jgi:hypothetical protein
VSIFLTLKLLGERIIIAFRIGFEVEIEIKGATGTLRSVFARAMALLKRISDVLVESNMLSIGTSLQLTFLLKTVNALLTWATFAVRFDVLPVVLSHTQVR